MKPLLIGSSWLARVAIFTLILGACSSSEETAPGTTGTPGVDSGTTGTDGSADGSSVSSFDDGSSAEAAMAVGTPESVCREFVAASCIRRQHCSPTIDQDMLNCLSYADLCPDYLFDSSDRTPQQVAACLPMVRDRSCSDIGLALTRGCGTPPGKRDIGENCLFAGQCASGVCSGGPSMCGSCKVAPTSQLGDTCSAQAPCPTGAFCHLTTRKCTDQITYGGVGSACDPTSDPVRACEKDLVCLPADGGTAGTCQLPATEGQPCVLDSFTRTHRCTQGLNCVPHGVSAMCENPLRCGAALCESNSYCAMTGGTPTCMPKAVLGAPCGGELVCVSPLQCTRVSSDGGAQCLKPEVGLLGESCNPHGCLGAYACRDGKCVPYPASECPAR